ncbi:MAG: FHA domain-containing protein [bacterium]|nr:FHA domain-containing protein [bacterium]
MRIQLEVLGGPLDGYIFQFNKRVQIGREGDVALSIDRFVSRHHAVLEPTAGGVILEDKGSTNGTFVAGERLHGSTTLHNGEEFIIGKTWLAITWT